MLEIYRFMHDEMVLGSRFRSFISTELRENERDAQINAMIDSAEYVLFFKKDKDIFAAPEEGRVVFAKIKHPDEDLPNGWEDEANFTADNLTKKLAGEPCQYVFHKDDIKKMKIIDREEAATAVRKTAPKVKNKPTPDIAVLSPALFKLFRRDPDDAPNFVRADEE